MASITKTFTALAIMRLIEQGKLSLDTELKTIAPEVPFTNTWENKHPVKLVHLLEHTTGFDDVHFNALFNNEGPISEYKAVLRYKKSMHCRWYPGERMAYCNTDYVILGYLIEKLSGQTYEAFLTDQVLRPLGMNHSYLNEIHSPLSAYAQGYSWEETGFTKIPSVVMYGKGPGALYSCAADMAKFIQFFLRNGQSASIPVFPASTIDQMEVPTSSVPAQNGMKTGYGLGITTGFLTAKFPFYGHGGLSIDFSSRNCLGRQIKANYLTISKLLIFLIYELN